MTPCYTRALVAVVGLCLGGCYLAHERGERADSAVDAPPIDGGACALLGPTDVLIDPPLPAGHLDFVRLDGFDADPAILGVRLHIDTCPMADAPCPHDVSIVGIGADVGARIQVPASAAMGFLGWDGMRTLNITVMDLRRCASCGGQLEILAGGLEAPLSGPAHTSDGEVDCASTCDDFRGVVVESHMRTVAAAQGMTAENGPLFLRVTQDARECVRCDSCTWPRSPASGLFLSADGVFATR